MVVDGLERLDSHLAQISDLELWTLRIFRNFKSGVKGIKAVVYVFLMLRSEAVEINKAPFCEVVFEFSDWLVFALRSQNFWERLSKRACQRAEGVLVGTERVDVVRITTEITINRECDLI